MLNLMIPQRTDYQNSRTIRPRWVRLFRRVYLEQTTPLSRPCFWNSTYHKESLVSKSYPTKYWLHRRCRPISLHRDRPRKGHLFSRFFKVFSDQVIFMSFSHAHLMNQFADGHVRIVLFVVGHVRSNLSWSFEDERFFHLHFFKIKDTWQQKVHTFI